LCRRLGGERRRPHAETAVEIDNLRRTTARHPTWKKDYPSLDTAVKDCQPDDVGLDKVWTRIDYFSKLRCALGSSGAQIGFGAAVQDERYGSKASEQLHKAVTEVYALKDEIAKLPLEKTFTVKEVLIRLAQVFRNASFECQGKVRPPT